MYLLIEPIYAIFRWDWFFGLFIIVCLCWPIIQEIAEKYELKCRKRQAERQKRNRMKDNEM